MNDTISKTEVKGCDVKQIDESISNQTTAKVKTVVTFPSSTKKIRSACMKMSGHGVTASNILFLLHSYQDLVEIDSEFLMMGTIISIPRKHANYWTIKWDNNLSKTKIQNKSLWSQVIKCDKEMVESLFDTLRRYDSSHPEDKHKQQLKRCIAQ